MAEGFKATNSGSSRCGPCRLMNVIRNPSGAGCRARRSGAGEDWSASAAGRNRKNKADPACAARFRRRSMPKRMAGPWDGTPDRTRLRVESGLFEELAKGHNSTSLQVPACKACWAAQQASDIVEARTIRRWPGSTPQPVKASGCKQWGGWISSTDRRSCRRAPREGGVSRHGESRCKTGCSRRNSPMPGRATSSSIKQPSGQPPPGNSADSAGYPVSRQAPSPALRAS